VLSRIDVELSGDLLFALVFVFRSLVIAASCMTAPSSKRESIVAAVLAGSLYLALVPHVLRWPVDGDEPYYVLAAESLIHDHDLDLSNQYRDLAHSAVRRADLMPQAGDPVGPSGQHYSRHEPFLPLLLIPFLSLGGLTGAVATIALFGALLVYSISRLMEDEAITPVTRRVVTLFVALGPPVIGYATRIWPELPAAFFLSEAVRASGRLTRGDVRWKQWARLIGSALALSLLKIRFSAIAAPLVIMVALALFGRIPRRRILVIAAVLIAIPFVVLTFAAGNPLNIHQLSELHPQRPIFYLTGFFGSLLDGAGGLLFQAPLFFLGLGALFSWRALPDVLRRSALASIPYLILLFPRAEWYGGWAPPLRYLVVFTPLLALSAAVAIERGMSRLALTVAGIWTAMLAVHAIAWPWRLFRLADGENFVGEWISRASGADVSRLFPSFIRLNHAALVASALLVMVAVVRRVRPRWSTAASEPMQAALMALFLAAGSAASHLPGAVVHFEDSHVTHRGGELFPGPWTPGRFAYPAGGRCRTGEGLDFRFRPGPALLFYRSSRPAEMESGTTRFALPSTGDRWRRAVVPVESADGVCHLRVVSGDLFLDRMERQPE
jgi:hypothetical protein